MPSLTAKQVRERLGVSAEQLHQWIADGLPTSGSKRSPKFDADTLRQWLIDQGHAHGELPPGALLVRASQGDREALRALAGDRVAKSLSEVAQYFGVQLATIKSGWRRAGDMPGREGHWPLAEILLWKIQRDTVPLKTEEAVARQTALDRKREADARKAEADAAAKELKNELTAGNLMYRADVEREVSEHLAVARHTLLRIPAQLIPMLPKEHAAELAERIKGEIERTLAVLADVEPALTGEQ